MKRPTKKTTSTQEEPTRASLLKQIRKLNDGRFDMKSLSRTNIRNLSWTLELLRRTQGRSKK
ncbi:MAG: hypothetical protein CMQ50_07650 [Gammaproteobacteria bacterium]|nr:hypothetical protein [Gammaproteobacteria bacterium]